jgi:hypothetical protein
LYLIDYKIVDKKAGKVMKRCVTIKVFSFGMLALILFYG